MKYNLRSFACIIFIAGIFFVACTKQGNPEVSELSHTNQFSSKVATDWFTLEADLARANSAFGPGTAGRAFAYTGLALYESVVPGMPSYQSVYGPITSSYFSTEKKKDYYWPACANAALAEIIRKLFVTSSSQGQDAINKLDSSNLASYQGKASTEQLDLSIAFGKLVGSSIFEWSKADGGVPPFTTYTPTLPVPLGEWEPTPPAFAPGVTPNWGSNRPIIPAVANLPLPPPPTPYSEDPSSGFYKMANDVYQQSTHLTPDDTLLVKTWFDIPGNYNGQTHLTKVLTQLIQAEGFDLEKAAAAYAQHGIAVNDAAIPCFKAKYTYKLIRPITYIRRVMGHTTWNTVLPTPPHPEYTAAHAVITGASATVLSYYFGNNYSFTDHTHDALYGPRSYQTIDEYKKSAGWSRVLAGVHYIPSVDIGYTQGKAVGDVVLAFPFKKG